MHNFLRFLKYLFNPGELTRLMTLNQDMDHQIRELLSRRALTEEQWAVYERTSRDYREMAQSQADVIFFLREKYPADFTSNGPHRNMNFGQIVLSYLKGDKQ